MWVAKMNTIKIKQAFGNNISIAKVKIPPETLKFVPNEFSKNESFHMQVAQLLESSLSANQNVPIVPYAEDNSIKEMRVQFVNGDITDLKLKDAEYKITLEVLPFEKHIEDKKNYTQIIYASFIKLKLVDVMDDEIMNASFRNIPLARLDKSANVTVNDWDEFFKSLHGLLDGFTKQISEMSSDWIEEATRTKNIKSQFGKFRSVLAEVR
jgi:hypothetical protein